MCWVFLLKKGHFDYPFWMETPTEIVLIYQVMTKKIPEKVCPIPNDFVSNGSSPSLNTWPLLVTNI